MKRILALIFVLSFLVLFSCKDDNLVSTLPTGTIVGFVYLNENTPYKVNDHSNISVVFENTNFATLTDSLGKWQMNNVPQGIYDIKFSKAEFCTFKKQGFQFVGDGTTSAGNVYLRKLPTFSVFNVSDSMGVDRVVVTFSMSDSGLNQYVRYFIGKTTNVEANTPFYTFEDIVYVPTGKTTFSFSVFKSDFDYFGLKSGEKVYMKIYPANAGFPISYQDIYTGVRVFPTLGENSSDVIEIIVP